jgi:hypothetical protein
MTLKNKTYKRSSKELGITKNKKTPTHKEALTHVKIAKQKTRRNNETHKNT